MKTEGRIIMTLMYLLYIIISLLIMKEGLVLITIGVLLGHLGLWVIESLEKRDVNVLVRETGGKE